MYREKKFLAIIPARSGSKGIKDKNIIDLNGKPLIAHTIENAKKSNIFTDIIVSTDSDVYADISRSFGAWVPFLREENLSKDTSSTEEVLLDVIKRLREMGKEYDYFVLLQPTSPLRTNKDIIKAANLIIDEELNSVVSVCEMDHSPLLSNTLPSDLSLKDFINKNNLKRRQELGTFYRINGAIYICRVKNYEITKSFYEDKSKAYIMDRASSIDIDEPVDLIVAKALMKDCEKSKED
ncbi:acylneuraminate cytidylyltransferase family protein [Clostridium chauvoei]|uniref:Acylneuraminate cytidylyltransferase family protein n=3 Tax=Clostridium chauvoei TaxID=46867 RepID=A0ABD4REN1_9CLOT|nr:acylneuraminate cytidylyltransferase family protein [Clostridium chauvoei]ATD54384.1 CMP-N-acetlyneuraminic acid synthetase [Clostridium chauvoei]ATD57933.1 CMP-N-acetlyneuraminic acid synthetase [Clostridium chauvoei]MBX7279724.1 acylneuraminate cytidylyltransferase family protein [Clostridium chauvoei]MBX7282093.1 acylneuraminate cytidylyltransferase family protein [Clostridium chauvoei]MBX7284615.1 acylneuraminate cytidylyltransferase family protein [Clostridium chauvoei]